MSTVHAEDGKIKARPGSKARRIQLLLEAGRKPAAVAEEVGCGIQYVFNVRRIFASAAARARERNYNNKSHRARYQTDPIYRAKHKARMGKWYRETVKRSAADRVQP